MMQSAEQCLLFRFLAGTGCNSRAALGLKIGVPVAVAVTVLIIVFAWKAHFYEIYKKTFRFARFSN